MRRFWVVWAAFLLAGQAFGQDAGADDLPVRRPTLHIHASSPWYLPRDVSLFGVVGRNFTPQLRIGWELAFIQEHADALMFVVEGGGGWALSTDTLPDSDRHPGMTWFSEQTIQAGLGYRQVFSGDWAWGFKLTVGPAWLGARSPGLPGDKVTTGLVEGRFELGRYFGQLQFGLTGGIQTVVDHPVNAYSTYGAGGGVIGVFANWR